MSTGPDWGALVSGWHLAWGPLGLVGAAALAYAAGVRRVGHHVRLGRRGRRWPARRSAAFAGGLLALATALASGVDARASLQLSTHMLQHLLLTVVAAPLLVAGAPLSLALQATQGRTRRRLSGAVRSRGVRTLTAAPVALGAFVAATVATHVPAVYDAALRAPLLHAAEHLLFLATGVLFWLPVVGSNPVPRLASWARRTAHFLLAMPAMTLVGVWLIASPSVVYPTYRGSAGALADQEAAGALMWVGGGVVMAAALLVTAMGALLAEERRQRAREATQRPPAREAPA